MPSWVKTHAYKKAQTHGVQLPSAQSGLKASFFFRFWVNFSIFFVKIAKIVHSLQIFTTHFNGFEGLGMGFNPCRFSLFRFSIFFRQNSKKLSILYRYLQPILCA
jgi:hypothetical protein